MTMLLFLADLTYACPGEGVEDLAAIAGRHRGLAADLDPQHRPADDEGLARLRRKGAGLLAAVVDGILRSGKTAHGELLVLPGQLGVLARKEGLPGDVPILRGPAEDDGLGNRHLLPPGLAFLHSLGD